jgi:regulator of protease activity HflC (stomatin/prohibitin superfamily)
LPFQKNGIFLCKQNQKNMFDKFIELVVTFIHDIIPWKIVDQWEAGVHLRTGKFYRSVSPGLNWKIPFFDQIITTPVITQTVNLSPQTVTSVDEKSVVLSSIVRYNIHDVEKFLLGVMHANDVLVDTTQGIIRDVVEGCKWSDLYDLGNVVTPEVNEQVEKWGITVEQVSFPDLGEIKTYRLITDGGAKNTTQIIPTE